jgi:hypothetical protein
MVHPHGLRALKDFPKQQDLINFLLQSMLGNSATDKALMTGSQAFSTLFDNDWTLESSLMSVADLLVSGLERQLEHSALLTLKTTATSFVTVLLK